MTITSPVTDPQVLGLFDNLRKLSDEVKAIDNELGADVSGPVAARNKLAKELAAKYTDDNVTGFVNKIVAQFDNAQFVDSDEKRAAVFTALNTGLAAIEKTVNDFLKKEVDAQPKTDVPTISDARKTELATERSKKTGMFKCQVEMLKFYDVNTLPSDIEVPVARRGSIGPRGAKFTKSYLFSFDGKPQILTDGDGVKSNASLGNLVIKTKDAGLNNTKELRDFIISTLGATVSEDGKTVDLPDTWSVTLPEPVGKTLSATVVTPAVDESPDDDDDTDTADANGAPEEDAFATS